MEALEIPNLYKNATLPEKIFSWLSTVDHKRIGIMYCTSAFVFLFLGGVEALIIRTQLWAPHLSVVGPDEFNEMFTMHGTTMIFFVIMPLFIGIANFVVPLQIGARDMAFPRLNAFGFWIFLFGGILLYYSFFTGGMPDVGWFAYAPLTEHTFSRGTATDYWILGTGLSGVGTLTVAVNFIATIITMRAPGMSLGRMPLFVWMILVDSFMIIFVFPPLTAAQVMLILDRTIGTQFFVTQAGGSSIFWQHLFWFFGHPEVYIMAIPAFGIISEVIPVFARKVIFGYESMAMSGIAIGFLSMGVWAHHMFAVGMGVGMNVFFAISSMLIAVPTGIKMFNWTATLYGGKIRLDTPMLFAIGFLVMFLLGGLSGVIIAMVPVDWQVTDSYFIVAHFHYVLFGGSTFAFMAAFYYWWPAVFGRKLSEKLGKVNFWVMFWAFNLAFGPMHVSGLLGMPRRIYTYAPGHGWEIWNQLSTVGAYGMGLAFLLFLINIIYTSVKGKPSKNDPWDAWTLEWATTCPVPPYNFEKIPPVRSRRPLWDLKHPDKPDWEHEGFFND